MALLLRPGPRKLVKLFRNNGTEISTAQSSTGIEIFTVSTWIKDNTEEVQTQYCKEVDIFPYSMFQHRFNLKTSYETCNVSKFLPGLNINDFNTQELDTSNTIENNPPQQSKEKPWHTWIAVVVMFVSWIFIKAGDTAVLTHFPVRAQLMGFSKNEAALLLSIQGAAQTIMCIPWGFIGDIKSVSETGLITIGSILCGACTCLSLIYKTFNMMVIHSILFGIGAGKYNEVSQLV